MLHSGLLPICVLVLQGQQYFLKVGVVLITNERLEHLVTLLQTHSMTNFVVRQIIKKVGRCDPNQRVISPLISRVICQCQLPCAKGLLLTFFSMKKRQKIIKGLENLSLEACGNFNQELYPIVF